jgi:hypothetical protein
LVGEAGHYLNRPGELRGAVLDLIRAHRDRLECLPRGQRLLLFDDQRYQERG